MSIDTATGYAVTGTSAGTGDRTVPQRTTTPVDPQLRPLPIWFFTFEGILGAAYDLTKADSHLLPVVIGIAAVNAVISMTVLRKRLKLVKSMLKSSRTRFIAIGLLALRFGVHLGLGLLGSAVSGVGGHILMAMLMAVCTVTLLWYDQTVSFRALGLSTRR